MDNNVFKPETALSLLIDRPVIEQGLIYKFTVSSRDLKRVFSEIQPLMAKTPYSKVIAVEYEDGKLRVRANTSLFFEAELDVLSSPPEEPFGVVCSFNDISEILPIKGDLEVTMTPLFVSFKSNFIESNLKVCEDEVLPTPEVYGEATPIALSSLQLGLKKLLSLTSISAVFKTGNVLIFDEDKMQVRYPTVWVQAPSSGLKTLLDYNSCIVVERFIQRTEDVVVYHTGDYVVLEKELTKLFIPKQPVDELEDISTYLTNSTLIGQATFQGLDKQCQSLLRTVGKTDAQVVVYDKGVSILVNTPDITATISNGDVERSERVLDSFVIRLEFLNSLLAIMDEHVKIYREGAWVCIKGQQVQAIISSK